MIDRFLSQVCFFAYFSASVSGVLSLAASLSVYLCGRCEGETALHLAVSLFRAVPYFSLVLQVTEGTLKRNFTLAWLVTSRP